jgi:hypothetical protein
MATTGEPGFAAGGMEPHRALAVATATGTPLYSCFARRGIYPPNNQAPGSGIRRAAAACMRLSVLLQLKRQRRRHCPPAHVTSGPDIAGLLGRRRLHHRRQRTTRLLF